MRKPNNAVFHGPALDTDGVICQEIVGLVWMLSRLGFTYNFTMKLILDTGTTRLTIIKYIILLSLKTHRVIPS